ncbi:hypothetical protein EHYA_06957 [Embleya hyalina]|uniref:Uncharacterized protein n=1 Tax=Embleya hyalina TaxID=516124 RepID=A0A401YXB4_9ACTN|nr:hypothetical protein EHYA_06957 [Embleya hyalina]
MRGRGSGRRRRRMPQGHCVRAHTLRVPRDACHHVGTIAATGFPARRSLLDRKRPHTGRDAIGAIRPVTTRMPQARPLSCLRRAVGTLAGVGEDVTTWRPVLPRGNGAWIGILASGRIGVGVAGEGRASLEGSGFVPMWPFMERGLSECLGEFRVRWDALADGGIASPERLFESLVCCRRRRTPDAVSYRRRAPLGPDPRAQPRTRVPDNFACSTPRTPHRCRPGSTGSPTADWRPSSGSQQPCAKTKTR